MLDHLVGRRHQVERLAGVPQLPTRLLAAAPPLAAGSLAAQWIPRRWSAAVVAVLGQPRFQLLHAREQPHNLLLRLLVQRLDARVLGFQVGDALVRGAHATMLHLQRNSV